MNEPSKTPKRARGVPETQQRGFGFEVEASQRPQPAGAGGVRFQQGQRRMFIGEEPLEQYLERSGL
ncbi:hypothetical protein, partial [Hyalangium gracile]|uniref:hypothetical protein n=1 Tax=Hyalangium gracile TaxID=394092 RepID=UPI001CCE2AB1